MERTTIYLNNIIKENLLDISLRESKKEGKRVGMAEIIREALLEYLKRRGSAVKSEAPATIRMLATKGALNEDFEKRVKEVQKKLNKWKI